MAYILRVFVVPGGNDSLVAFSRLHGVTIVIHQLNEPVWKVSCDDSSSAQLRELHISYHNGDHYNSVRRIGDTNGRTPANIRLEADSPRSQTRVTSARSDNVTDDDFLSDYENNPIVAEPIREVMRKSGVKDPLLAAEALEENAKCVEAAVDYLLHLGSLGVEQLGIDI